MTVAAAAAQHFFEEFAKILRNFEEFPKILRNFEEFWQILRNFEWQILRNFEESSLFSKFRRIIMSSPLKACVSTIEYQRSNYQYSIRKTWPDHMLETYKCTKITFSALRGKQRDRHWFEKSLISV